MRTSNFHSGTTSTVLIKKQDLGSEDRVIRVKNIGPESVLRYVFMVVPKEEISCTIHIFIQKPSLPTRGEIRLCTNQGQGQGQEKTLGSHKRYGFMGVPVKGISC